MYKQIAITSHKPWDMIVSPTSPMESLRYGDHLSLPINYPKSNFEKYLKLPDTKLHEMMWNLFDWLTSNSTLKKVARDMVNHFMYNGTNTFTSTELNNCVGTDLYFLRWVNYIMQDKISTIINKAYTRQGTFGIIEEYQNLPSFAFGRNLEGYVKSNPLSWVDNKMDQRRGLPILIDNVWAATVEVDDIRFYNIDKFSGKFRFTLYDDFGLDKGDLEGNCYDKVPPDAGESFVAWYALQHYRSNHKPFITKVMVEKYITSSL